MEFEYLHRRLIFEPFHYESVTISQSPFSVAHQVWFKGDIVVEGNYTIIRFDNISGEPLIVIGPAPPEFLKPHADRRDESGLVAVAQKDDFNWARTHGWVASNHFLDCGDENFDIFRLIKKFSQKSRSLAETEWSNILMTIHPSK